MVALVSYGIYRLSDVVFKLRELGYGITTDIKTDEAGHKYAEYTLEWDQNGRKVSKA